ncbi:VRR-NUC domain-containing protein [Candidatus Parcubacteria bacterium]|nr:MAG: VRR-NUC domain-containing protein [Candidatus Parcubacteria bacterium]
MKEADIQRAIVNYLRSVLLPTHRVVAFPNASRRTATGRAANAVPGLTPGVFDLIIFGGSRCWWMEVKTQKGRLSHAQEEWRDWLLTMGLIPFAVVRSIDDARTAINAWGIPNRESVR